MHVQDKQSQEDHMLEACRPLGFNGHVKTCLNEAIPYYLMGEQIASLHEATVIK